MSSSEDSDDNFATEEGIDDERTAIRSELSSLSFEELQKLKEKIGAKVYKEALFGKNDETKSEKPKIFKRENKNRPREMSSKRPVSMLLDVTKVKKREVRDPRFDPLCGEFDKKQFSQDYNFLSEIRMKDIKKIRSELKQTTDPEREKKLRRLLQRLNDQHKATKKRKEDDVTDPEREKKLRRLLQRLNDQHKTTKKRKEDDITAKKDRNQIEQVFKDGQQPHFKNKSERRVEALVQQYEELKREGTGRIQRHLKRRQQKIKKRSHRAPIGVS